MSKAEVSTRHRSQKVCGWTLQLTVLRWKGCNILIICSNYMQELHEEEKATPALTSHPLTSHQMVGGWRCSAIQAGWYSNLRTIHDAF